VLEGRKPLLVLRFAGALLLQFAERTFAGRWFRSFRALAESIPPTIDFVLYVSRW
jgi:hypothetical protein